MTYVNPGEPMKFIGKSKISKLHPQPNTIYPLIRLPQQCADVIGETAHIFQTEYEGEKAFFILLKNKETTKRKIIKEFIKSKPEIDLKSHLITVESKIDEIFALLFKNRDLINDNYHQNEMGSAGFGPATSAMSRRRHNQLDHEPLRVDIMLCLINLMSEFVLSIQRYSLAFLVVMSLLLSVLIRRYVAKYFIQARLLTDKLQGIEGRLGVRERASYLLNNKVNSRYHKQKLLTISLLMALFQPNTQET